MLTILVAGLFVTVTSIFPVVFAANKLGAQKTGLIDCLIAVIIALIASAIFVPIMPSANTSEALFFLYTLIITGVVYKFFLQSDYMSGMLISLISTLIKAALFFIIWKVVK